MQSMLVILCLSTLYKLEILHQNKRKCFKIVRNSGQLFRVRPGYFILHVECLHLLKRDLASLPERSKLETELLLLGNNVKNCHFYLRTSDIKMSAIRSSSPKAWIIIFM